MRRMRSILVGVTALLGAAAPLAPALAASAIEGTWVTTLQSEITISPCEAGYCGYLTKIVVPDYVLDESRTQVAQMTPEQYLDARNKDPQLRNRPILGLQILTLRPGNSARVFDGDIYNPEDGNTYSGYIEVLDEDAIRLNGCVLYNLICRGEEWMRVSQ